MANRVSAMRYPAYLVLAASALALAACNSGPPEPQPTPDATPTDDAKPVSILRPDVDQPENPLPLDPLVMTIGFPGGGSDLSEKADTQLEDVLGSPQFKLGGPIILRGHSDSAGTDAANMRASKARAEAVKDWLTEKGVEEDRITVIAFGEQNPAQPNAKPDGSPDEEARAANRRVELVVQVPEEPPEGSILDDLTPDAVTGASNSAGD